MKRLIRYDLIGFLQASRIPNLFIIGSTQYLTLIFLTYSFPRKKEIILSLDFFLMVVSTALISAGGYIINDYYDQKIDLINRPNKVVVGTKIRRRLAILSHLVLSLLGIGLGFYIDLKIGVIHVFSAFCLWYYSNFLRRLPLVGNLVISSLTSLTMLIVALFIQRSEILIYIYSAFAFAIVLIREVIKDMEDFKGDSAYGVQSIPVLWGIRSAKVFIYIIIVGSISFLLTFLIRIDNWQVRYYFIGLFPLFVWFTFKLYQADRKAHFTLLHNFTNVIILTGLISMLMIRQW
ncbi:MAG: 4-hydroxybenzoate polyprenyltransferase [Cyclobacteriaceae bacterium]|jgi:4-hydroxybenzoate polyprenyltransferase